MLTKLYVNKLFCTNVKYTWVQVPKDISFWDKYFSKCNVNANVYFRSIYPLGSLGKWRRITALFMFSWIAFNCLWVREAYFRVFFFSDSFPSAQGISGYFISGSLSIEGWFPRPISDIRLPSALIDWKHKP